MMAAARSVCSSIRPSFWPCTRVDALHFQKSLTVLGRQTNNIEGLVEFVRNGSRHFSERRKLRRLNDLRLGMAQFGYVLSDRQHPDDRVI